MKASDERGPQYLRARPASKSARPIVAEALARHAGPGEFTLVAARALGRTDGQCWRSRHLAVVIRDAHDCAAAARALLALVRASARTHLVLDLRRARPARETRAAWRWPAFAVLFDRCLGHGDLERAEAVASAACCLSALRGVPLSSGWRLRIATLRFWEGRYEEADRIVGRVGGRTRGPAGLAWIALGGLVAWMTGNLRALSRAAHRLDRRRLRRRDAAIWRDGFRLLRAAAGGAGRGIARRAAALSARARGAPARLWARVMASEALSVAGDRARAAALLPSGGVDARTPACERLLTSWMTAALRADEQAQARIRRQAIRCGAIGITRWGSRDMQTFQTVPALLQLVHEAEDELAALTGACRWVRREAAADAVMFLDGDGEIVASDGAPGELGAEISAAVRQDAARVERAGRIGVIAPVRYAGARTGAAAVLGPPARTATFEEAARTLAALCAPALRTRLDLIALARASHSRMPEILGRSPEMVALREAIARAAPTPFPVLIEGESGTGKELVARAIHRLSARRDRRFCAVNCAALTDELVEAELFGHARGAFTGAVGPRAGLFEESHHGTLFLDEIRELSARAQAKLLRALQEREIRRLGENAPRPVDVRIVAATNQPLADVVARGAFRDDLLFRLAVVRLTLPPLRDRVEDVPLLAVAAWTQMIGETGKRAVLGPDAVACLCRHRWPGNVRELQNVIASLLVLAPARGRVSARHVAQVLSGPAADTGAAQPLDRARATFERRAVAAALARHAGRRTAAARELGLTRQGLTKAIKRLGLAVQGGEADVA